MEFRYVYALKCPSQPVGEGTSYLNILLEYIENFHDQTDVVEEIRPYLTLLKPADNKIIFNRIESRIKMITKLDSEDREAKGPKSNAPFIASVKLLRYQFVAFKLFRVIGLYSAANTVQSAKTANEILTVFLQAMEHHPNILSTEGVGAKHSG